MSVSPVLDEASLSSVSPKKSPVPAVTPSDAADASRIADRARNRLWQSTHLAMRTVSCEYEEGTLVLTGRLPSFYHKQLAQEVVLNVEGVTRLVNQIEVASMVAS
jgi:osmotically-inducible protein OsmY